MCFFKMYCLISKYQIFFHYFSVINFYFNFIIVWEHMLYVFCSFKFVKMCLPTQNWTIITSSISLLIFQLCMIVCLETSDIWWVQGMLLILSFIFFLWHVWEWLLPCHLHVRIEIGGLLKVLGINNIEGCTSLCSPFHCTSTHVEGHIGRVTKLPFCHLKFFQYAPVIGGILGQWR